MTAYESRGYLCFGLLRQTIVLSTVNEHWHQDMIWTARMRIASTEFLPVSQPLSEEQRWFYWFWPTTLPYPCGLWSLCQIYGVQSTLTTQWWRRWLWRRMTHSWGILAVVPVNSTCMSGILTRALTAVSTIVVALEDVIFSIACPAAIKGHYAVRVAARIRIYASEPVRSAFVGAVVGTCAWAAVSIVVATIGYVIVLIAIPVTNGGAANTRCGRRWTWRRRLDNMHRIHEETRRINAQAQKSWDPCEISLHVVTTVNYTFWIQNGLQPDTPCGDDKGRS